MRIYIDIHHDRLEVDAVFRAHNYHIDPSLIEFIADTGSQRSFISYKDALRLHIPLNNLIFVEHMQFGGTKFSLNKIKKIVLTFLNDDNKPEKFEFDEFLVASPTKKGEGKFLAEQLPSILGLDFLIKNNLGLQVNPSKREAFFERTE